MSTMLASDINNPNFVGADNPDRNLHVEFKEISIKSQFKSEKEERPIFDTVLICTVTPPGGLLSVPAVCTEDHKRRFPFHWQQYQNSKGEGLQVQGTPLDEWPALDVGQRDTLKASKFYTVEQIANASDVQVQAMGMGGQALQQKAQAYLQNASGNAAAAHLATENAKKDERIKALEEQMAAILAAQPKQKQGTRSEAL